MQTGSQKGVRTGAETESVSVGGEQKTKRHSGKRAGGEKKEGGRRAAFRGLAGFALKHPEIPLEIIRQMDGAEEGLFLKIFDWLNRGKERCRRFPGESRWKAVLRCFKENTVFAEGYEGLIESCEEAFSRIDFGGYESPGEDRLENWFAVTFQGSAEDVFVSRTGAVRRRGLREALLWIKKYSLVPVFDFEYVINNGGLVFSEERNLDFKAMFPKTLHCLTGKPDARRLPPVDTIAFHALRESFQDYQKALKQWVSEKLDDPPGFMPRFCIRTVDEGGSGTGSYDLMREAWDAMAEYIENEVAADYGFFQIGVDLRSADPDVFLRLLKAASQNFGSQKRIMELLED